MRENGALGVCMSGSGPTVFGIFENKQQAEKAADKLAGLAKDIAVTTPVSKGCTHPLETKGRVGNYFGAVEENQRAHQGGFKIFYSYEKRLGSFGEKFGGDYQRPL